MYADIVAIGQDLKWANDRWYIVQELLCCAVYSSIVVYNDGSRHQPLLAFLPCLLISQCLLFHKRQPYVAELPAHPHKYHPSCLTQTRVYKWPSQQTTNYNILTPPPSPPGFLTLAPTKPLLFLPILPLPSQLSFKLRHNSSILR